MFLVYNKTSSKNKEQSTTELKGNNCTLTEKSILEFLQGHPMATQLEIAEAIGKSVKTIKNSAAKLQADGFLKREGAKKTADGLQRDLVEISTDISFWKTIFFVFAWAGY